MKQITLIVLSFVSLFFAACEKEAKSYNLAIDLQSSFDHDNVKVFIDGHIELDRLATTNHLLGFAASTTTSRNSGNHQVKVVVNNSISKTAVVPLNDNLFIGVNYNNQTQKITIQYSNQPFAYD